MMVAGQFNEADNEYSDEIYSGSEIEDEDFDDEQEEYVIQEPFKPTTFEDFNSSYRGRAADVAEKFDPSSSYQGRAADGAEKFDPPRSYQGRTADVAEKFDPPSSYQGRAADVAEKFDTKSKEKEVQIVPQNVEKEIEEQIEKEIVKISQASVKASEPTKSTPLLYPEHYEMESVEPEEYEDEEELDEEEIEYEEDENEIESVEDEEEDEIEEDISDIDDDDLMKRLEAKYGKIDDKNNKSDDDADESWTSN